MNLNQVTLPVNNMEKSTEFYRTLGFTQIVDTPHYARFECPEGDSTFSLSLENTATYTTIILIMNQLYFSKHHTKMTL